MKHDLRWFEEYAQNVRFLKPLTPVEWNELASLLHEVNSREKKNKLTKEITKKWTKIEDDNVQNVWAKDDKDNCSFHAYVDYPFIVSPKWLQENNYQIPKCSCGKRLKYSHTEILV